MTSWTHLPQAVYNLITASPGSILLQTSRFDTSNQTSYLFLNPINILIARSLDQLPSLFQAIEEALNNNQHVAGYLSYEGGYSFERFNRIPIIPNGLPLAWFGVYSKPITFRHSIGEFASMPPRFEEATLKNQDQPFTEKIALDISSNHYQSKILAIKTLIANGDTYQVNFTDRVSFDTPLSPESAFALLSKQQPSSYSAFLNISGHYILSFSPELFFKIEDCKITTRPMKGTGARSLDLNEDNVFAQQLQQDEKNRSEHIMIVDLLRNDLGRICTMGSVHVDDLFTIERYPTLHQMTSTVSGTLRPGITFHEIFRALFPSGSITGAPKIRAMQIIRDLETQPRGVYTGAIGYIAPDRSAQFNVAIRTLTLKDGVGQMGVGGGIVADSDSSDEYAECLLKASFLSRLSDFELIETMLWNNGFHLLDHHLDRLGVSAQYFNFPYRRNEIIAQLETLACTFPEHAKQRVRLLLSSAGRIDLIATPISSNKSIGKIYISSQVTSSDNLFLRHKTTRRELYDREYQRAFADGFDEVIFLNERNEITEGAISNLFLCMKGALLTPPLGCGVLPGIYRQHILNTDPNAREKILTIEDLHTAEQIYICNSVRGMKEVRLFTSPTP